MRNGYNRGFLLTILSFKKSSSFNNLFSSFDIDYKIQLKFLFDVYEFNPRKCILTQSLLPMCIYKSEHALQPIWVHNPFSHDLDFKITTEDRNVRIVEEKVHIPSKATRPIVIQFSPSSLGDYEVGSDPFYQMTNFA